jgi:hypothetical protein
MIERDLSKLNCMKSDSSVKIVQYRSVKMIIDDKNFNSKFKDFPIDF